MLFVVLQYYNPPAGTTKSHPRYCLLRSVIFFSFLQLCHRLLISRVILYYYNLLSHPTNFVGAGALIVGGYYTTNKVEVFNPNTKRVCSLPALPDRSNSYGAGLCGNLYCIGGCFKWENGMFVKTQLTLRRYWHMCWALDNGVLLLGGRNQAQERF